MKIKWLGHSCFLITLKDGRKIITDPYDDTVGYRPVDESSDFVLVSHDHFDHNCTDGIKGSYTKIDSPGEHIIDDGLSFTGIEQPHDEENGKKRGTVITYIIKADGLTVLHLGDLGIEPSDNYLEQLPLIDIMLIPVGGVYTINGDQACSVLEKIHPNITIPMHYMTEELTFRLDSIQPFIDACRSKVDISRLSDSEFEIDKTNLKKRQRVIVMKNSN